MRGKQANLNNPDMETVCESAPRLDNDAFTPESRIIIDGKVYLIQRHFISKRDFKEAVFTVVKNDAKRVLLDVS